MPYVNQHDDKIDRFSDELKDYLFDHYLDQVTPLVFADMVKYYGLTEEEIVQAMDRVADTDLSKASVQDKLIEQEFVNSQVWYLQRIINKSIGAM